MSQRPIARSPDLRRLRDEGFEVEVRGGLLLVHGVPYVTSARVVKRATLVSELTLAGDVTTRPGAHIMRFTGEYPCHPDGREIEQIRHQAVREAVSDGVIAQFSFSNKPPGGYENYYEKVITYADIISGPASATDPTATARTFKPVPAVDDESPFHYADTATSRAGIDVMTRKLRSWRIAIVGLGGTGSYVLDLVAKTPVAEIHLFDGDTFLQHNAFRGPGAPTLTMLEAKTPKVQHWAEVYSRMHRGVVSHPHHIDASNVHLLDGMNMVFICVDKGRVKRPIVDRLAARGAPFIDVGMGVSVVDDKLIGVIRVTTGSQRKIGHIATRIAFDDDQDDDYATNIQIAELNALNAAMAVVKWKKLAGFYHDHDDEHHTTYSVDGNLLTSEDTTGGPEK